MGDNAAPFGTGKNAMGVTSVVDTRKKAGGAHGVIAIFFADPKYPARAEMYAKVCAAALNEEAARRAKKE